MNLADFCRNHAHDRDRRVERFAQQRDTGHRNLAGQLLFQDVDSGEMYWASRIRGMRGNWTMQKLCMPRCSGWLPTAFSVGAMQACDCPTEFRMNPATLAVYPV